MGHFDQRYPLRLVLWCLRFRLKAAIGLAILLSAALVIGQGIKSLIKDRVQEPRPFVVWLEQNHGVDGKYFYSLHRKERSALVREQLQDQTLVPKPAAQALAV